MEKDTVTIKAWSGTFSGSDAGEAWLMTELITKTGIVTWSCQGQIDSFRIPQFIHYGDGEASQDVWLALVLPGNRFYGLESVPFSFFFISCKELFILLLCTRKTHLESECIGIRSLVEVSVIPGKKFIMYFLWSIIWFWISSIHGNRMKLSGAVNMFCRVILKAAAIILKLLEGYPLEVGRKYFICIIPAVTRMLLEFHL